MAEEGLEQLRGKKSAWLMKKKSGSSVVRVREYNKRYFTLDFDLKVFFYAHNATSKKASTVVPFADLVDVRRPEVPSDNISECSKASKTSFLRRMGSNRLIGGKDSDEKEQHTLLVLSRPAKIMELLCNSAAEAQEWYDAFKAASAWEGGSGTGVPDPSFFDRMPSNGSAQSDGSGDCALHGSHRGSSSVGSPPSAFKGTSPNIAGAPGVATEATAKEGNLAQEPHEAPPKPAPSTFMDFTIEPDKHPQMALPIFEQVNVAPAHNDTLQASDFGFDGGVESDSSEDEAAVSPSLAKGAATDTAKPTSTARSAHRDDRSAIYGDKQEGLSMQERLANLEFSDGEEDDDDPLGLKNRTEES